MVWNKQGNIRGPNGGLEIAATVISGPTNPVTNNTYYTQGQVVVPAGPAHLVEVVGGLTIQVQTGTQPIDTLIRADVSLFDEASTLLGYSPHTFVQDTAATTKGFQATVPIAIAMPANAATKTYTLQVRGVGINVNAATLTVLIGGIFPTKTLRAVYR